MSASKMLGRSIFLLLALSLSLGDARRVIRVQENKKCIAGPHDKVEKLDKADARKGMCKTSCLADEKCVAMQYEDSGFCKLWYNPIEKLEVQEGTSCGQVQIVAPIKKDYIIEAYTRCSGEVDWNRAIKFHQYNSRQSCQSRCSAMRACKAFRWNGNMNSCVIFKYRVQSEPVIVREGPERVCGIVREESDEEPPNVIVIITDEHSFRTLGSYRRHYRDNLGQHSQTNVWGKRNFVYTPNIDKLADTGALFSNFYTVTPLCTPSRASFMSGLYPAFTGESELNHGRMDDDVKTFAHVLRDQRGFFTSYVGKWHLNGEAKPGWQGSRDFGFTNRSFQFNRGHYKYFSTKPNGQVQEYTAWDDISGMFENNEEEHFSTDFLFNRGMKQIENAIERGEGFATVFSIPDPHDPNVVRKPYNTMYKDLKFEIPESGKAAIRRKPATPIWNNLLVDFEDTDSGDADKLIKDYEASIWFQNHMQQYFGMVKCIDDNVGKLMNFLEVKGVKENTIVIFTSDHGDMLFEHGKMNKDTPYETSAGIPFIVNWPKKISPKVIETPYSSVDLFPTLLGLIGVNDSTTDLQGVDASTDLLSDRDMISDDDKVVFTFDSSRHGRWAAAVMKGFKLVVSKGDRPWLFDLNKDPDEMINFFSDVGYSGVVRKLQTALFTAIDKYKAPLGELHNSIYWDMPACMEAGNAITVNGQTFRCNDLGYKIDFGSCREDAVRKMCPKKCGGCCQDSVGKLWISGELKDCSELSEQCSDRKVQTFCPSKCQTC